MAKSINSKDTYHKDKILNTQEKLPKKEDPQKSHGGVDSYLNLQYSSKEKSFQKIINDAMTCCDFDDEENDSNGKKNKASILDIFNTGQLTKHNFSFLLNNLLKKIERKKGIMLYNRSINELTEEGLEYVSVLLNEACDYYENHLLRKIGNTFKNNRGENNKIQFNTTKKVREFFNHSSIKRNQTATRQIHCSLLKIAYGINDIKTHEEEINKAEEEFGKIKQDLFFSNFLDQKNKEATETTKGQENNFSYVKLKTKYGKEGKGDIFFSCSGRVKKKEKILIKGYGDPKYNSVKAINDIYGIRNEVKTPEDALFLLEYIRINVFNKKGEIIYKNIFGENMKESKEFLRQYAGDLDPNFYAMVFNSLVDSSETKIKCNKNYKDIKIIRNLGGHKAEVQINLVGNDNETGYANHQIFDCKKKIRALSRLQGYINKNMINTYIKEAIMKDIAESKKFGEKSDLIGLGGYHGSIEKIQNEDIKKSENAIFDYLINEQNIVKLNIPGISNNITYYTSLSNRNHFQKDGKYTNIYPKGAKIKDIKTDQRTNQSIAA